jgi:hypothetical protein
VATPIVAEISKLFAVDAEAREQGLTVEARETCSGRSAPDFHITGRALTRRALTKGWSSCELLVVSEMWHVHDIRIKRWSGGDQGSQEMNGEATAINWIFLESLAGRFRSGRAGVGRFDAV